MTLALSLAAVPVGSSLYRTLGLDQYGMRGTTAAPFLVAHHIPPFGVVDIPMPVRKRPIAGVHEAIMPRSQDVADLVRNGISDGSARVMHHEERLF
jgi:hypothetical protein